MVNSNALVSIIVPIYGTEAYLPNCIKSLCQQTYSNIQIILIDDQSPDRCPEICDQYAEKDKRIMVIHQKNTGVSGARNTGLRHATGKYIMFVDSDDELTLNATEILVKDAEAYSADIVTATSKTVNESGQVINVVDDGEITVLTEEKPLLLSLSGDYSTDAVWANLFRADFIRGILFEVGKNIHEDGFFMFQCYLRKPILVHHNIPVYQYNIREDSCSRQVFSEKYLSMLYFCDRKKELISELFPEYVNLLYNVEVRTNLQLLDLLCTSKNKQHKATQDKCLSTVRRFYKYHKPINKHHKMLAWIVKYRLFTFYKLAFRMKYCR